MSNSKLNPNAKSFKCAVAPIQDFQDFFTVLFKDWGGNHVDSIVSRLDTVKTLGAVTLLFDELFKAVYILTADPNTCVKVDNVVSAIDTLDNQLPQIIITCTSDPASAVVDEYFKIRKSCFETCFKRISNSFEIVAEAQSDVFLKELEEVLLVLAKMSQIHNYEDYTETLLNCLWDIYKSHFNHAPIVLCMIQTISYTLDRLLDFLKVFIDPNRKSEDIKSDQRRAKFAVEIFAQLKEDLINKQYHRDMIVHVLHILDQHDRFIGRFLDGIPENKSHKGYIVCPGDNSVLEPEDVYQEYEQFLDTT